MLKKILIVLAILIGIIVIGGYLLPLNYSVSRTKFINAEADTVHASVANLKSWPQWTPWNHQLDPTLQFQYSGPDSQVGSISTWTGEKAGSGLIEIISAESGRGIVYKFSFDDYPPAEGVIQITPMKGGCEVFWKVSGELVPPLGGWFRPLIDSMIGSDFEKGLDGLKIRCEAN